MDGTDTTVARLCLEHFRAIEAADIRLGSGLTVFVGANAQGKTSVLESVCWIARGRSFRGVADHVLVNQHQASSIVRAEVTQGSRHQLFEAEIRAAGRNRVQLNGSPVNRRRDLAALLRVSVFAPDDLDLVKSGPSSRRDYLDDLLASLALRYDVARGDFERILKHRNALLRTGVRDGTDRSTLEVFDEQLVIAGSEVVRGRLRLVRQLGDRVANAYQELAGRPLPIGISYRTEWHDGSIESDDVDDLRSVMREAIERLARKEFERRVTLVGPHRDELALTVAGLDARTHASQGEQRTLALALRLAGHRLVSEVTGSTPVLLLDDVFSELDDQRAAALVERLPPGQTLLTTAGSLPPGMVVEQMLRVDAGKILA